ncbi:MAG: PKD domain-containing protein [Thermoanaerobaculia bacterium]
MASRRAPLLRSPGIFVLLGLGLFPARLGAQCILSSAPVPFEPNPPGATRPLYGAPLGQLSPGFSTSLALYRNGAGSPRILMNESFGYSTLDISNPLNPTALKYDDLRFDPASGATNPVPANGDGQSYIQTLAVSPNGQRVVFSVSGPAEPTWHTLAGRPDGGEGFGMWGDFGNSRASGTVVQQVGSRYIAYAIYPTLPAMAADVTTLPTSNGAFRSLNLASETTSFPPGSAPSMAGNFLVYLTSSGVQIVDASNPGPPGNITSAFRSRVVSSVPGDPFSRVPVSHASAVDPLDANKLWVLVELPAAAGENSPSYGLVSVTKDGSGNLQAPVSAGALFRVPSVPGETWGRSGGSASLVASNFQLFALMWATRVLPSQQFILYSTTASVWATPQATPVSAAGFGLAATSASAMAGSGMSVYQFLPTGPRAFVVPLTCQALNAPAVSVLSVTNAGTGASVPDGGTAFLGDTLTIVPAVLPSPAIKPLSDWRFDFDFHAGSMAEDNGATPRIRNLDNGQFGNPAAPPAQATLVGPCDPQAGGVPASGAGCWNSVRTNSAAGGPDFATSSPPAGTQVPLKIALEATNQYGIQNTALFTVNWRVPAVGVASTQVFLGAPLVSASEGQPSSFKWFFGASPTTLTQASCTGPSCVPTLDTRGTHYFWLTATYPGGYRSPDYDGTSAMGTYTVIDFAPAFTVNGSATGPVTADVSQNLTIANSSQHSPSVTGSYFYSLCQIPGGQTTCSGTFSVLTGMTDPPSGGTPATYATVSAPSTPGNYLFRVQVSYTGGTATWPDPGGVAGIPITVRAPTPEMHIFVNGQDPCPPGPFCIVNRVSAKAGDTLTAYSYVNGIVDNGTVALSWDFSASATPQLAAGNGVTFTYGAAGTYDITLTRNGLAYPFPGAAVIAPRPLPPVATASATPNPATFVNSVQLTCSATGGTGGYSYAWSLSDGATGSGSTIYHVFGATGSYGATCTVTDTGTGLAGQSSVTVNVTLPPGSGGPYSLFVLSPCRVLDTRNPAGALGGPAIQPSGAANRVFAVASSCAIPSDAKAISANVTVTNVSASGVVSIYRGNGQPTGTSTVPLVVGRTRANNAMLQLASDGSGTIKVQNTSAGTLDLIVDVNGYFR